MAEQAQRRAPQGQSQQDPPNENDNHAFEELRHLIIAPEQEEIADIQHRLEDWQRRAQDLSSVVAEAIKLRRDQGDDRALADALGPTIEETLRDSVRKHPHVLADALFPVMGPAIRKSITETLRSMLESFNEALEHSLSWRGIKWRIEALRTGKSFGEIVMIHSLVYRVEEVFLIHRETGLVLNHITAPSITPMETDMFSGMLSAIQQFAHDTGRAKRDEELEYVRVGDLLIWVEVGPHALIAAAFRGHAPEDYRIRMREVLESVEERFNFAFENFQGDAGPFRGAEELLSPLLEARFREAEEPGKKRKPRMLIAVSAIIVAAILGWGAYFSYRVHQWTQFEQALRREPGIVVISVSKEGGRHVVSGFRDSHAADPKDLLANAGLTSDWAVFHLAPFYSTDDSIVLRHVRKLLAPPAGVTLSVKDGVLVAEGAASPKWIARLRDRATWVAGVRELDDSKLQDANILALKGAKSSVESIVFLFPLGIATLEPGQDQKIALAQKNIQEIVAQAIALNENVQIEVVGHTDNTGVEATNLLLSKQRADEITNALKRAGVQASSFRPRGVGTKQPLRTDDTDEGRQLNRSVTFQVDISPVAP
jgi:outer membrane protein OmpA-like peptidoglycan-associated protein